MVVFNYLLLFARTKLFVFDRCERLSYLRFRADTWVRPYGEPLDSYLGLLIHSPTVAGSFKQDYQSFNFCCFITTNMAINAIIRLSQKAKVWEWEWNKLCTASTIKGQSRMAT